MKRNQIIDILRGLAVLLVVCFHAFPGLLKAGYIGVDLFFVISGFVIFGAIKERGNLPLREQWLGFYYRRAYRILPPLAVALIAGATINALFIPYCGMSKDVFTTGIGAIAGLANHVIENQKNGYFAAQGDYNLFHHTWSLGVEEQFYLLAPVMIMVCAAKWGYRPIRYLLGLGIAASLTYCAIATTTFGASMYLSTSGRIWELLAGMAIFQLGHRTHSTVAKLPGPDRPVGSSVWDVWLMRLAMITIVVLAISIPQSQFPYPMAILPVLCGVVLLAGSGRLTGKELMGSDRVAAGLSYIGTISYSLYLWHWLVLVGMNWTIGLDHALQNLGGLLLSTLLASASHRLCEKPAISFAKRTSADRRWLLPFAGSALAVFSLAGGFYYSRSVTLSVTGKNQTDWYQPAMKLKTLIPGDSAQRFTGHTLFIFGDSHAQAYQGIFAELPKAGISVYLDREAGRGFNLVKPLGKPGNDEWEGFAEALKAYAKPGDIVFLPALRVPRYCELWEAYDKKAVHDRPCYVNLESHVQAIDEFSRVISRLKLMGLKVLVDAPKPVLPAPAFRVSDWFNHNNPIARNGLEISAAYLQGHRTEVLSALKQVAADQGCITLWDPFPLLCAGSVCRAFEGNRPLYFDGDHLSNYGCQKLTGPFLDVLAQVWSVHSSG
jgi:peptidoglycan/LPS O-acetylase OafA/YrhL